MVPWPISERAMRMTTVSFGWITTQALTSGTPSCARAILLVKGISKPRAKPPVTAAELTMKERRFIFMGSLSSGFRRVVDRRAHFLERPAAADIGDGGVDVRVGGLGLLRQQGSSGHDHAGLAVAALRHFVLDPCGLNLVQLAAARQAFDGGDLLADGRAHWHH